MEDRGRCEVCPEVVRRAGREVDVAEEERRRHGIPRDARQVEGSQQEPRQDHRRSEKQRALRAESGGRGGRRTRQDRCAEALVLAEQEPVIRNPDRTKEDVDSTKPPSKPGTPAWKSRTSRIASPGVLRDRGGTRRSSREFRRSSRECRSSRWSCAAPVSGPLPRNLRRPSESRPGQPLCACRPVYRLADRAAAPASAGPGAVRLASSSPLLVLSLLLYGPLGKGLRLESLVRDRYPALDRSAVRTPRERSSARPAAASCSRRSARGQP